MRPEEVKIGVIGLGYVGLPLAVAFAKKFSVVGYDIDPQRIDQLQRCRDSTLEVDEIEIKSVIGSLKFTNADSELFSCNYYICTVPTPVDDYKKPDLESVTRASKTIASVITKGDLIIYESTVYPGVTEEICVPILESVSGLTCGIDFFVGYSPERINPGDKTKGFSDIVKITSGLGDAAAEKVDELYQQVVAAGTFKAASVKVAEAAKVIENIQRDVNIALVNELALLFDKLGVETNSVLEAARTKWNFMDFRPGLVGGHCIGVDPYYLTHKAQAVGYHPEMILAGRRLNDGMARFVAEKMLVKMTARGFAPTTSKVLLLGLTFKENCPDLRNSQPIKVYQVLKQFGFSVDVFDPVCDPNLALSNYNIDVSKQVVGHDYDGIVVAVGHKEFVDLGELVLRDLCKPKGVIFDVKSIFPSSSGFVRL